MDLIIHDLHSFTMFKPQGLSTHINVISGDWNSLFYRHVHENKICCIGICDVVDCSEPNAYTNKDKNIRSVVSVAYFCHLLIIILT